MKFKTVFLSMLALTAILLMAGCGGGDEKTEAAATPEASTTAETAAEVAAAHDCDGGCGMTAVPMAKLVQINDKYYCAGCAAKAKAAAEGEANEAAESHGNDG